jgi:hypothetical protein
LKTNIDHQKIYFPAKTSAIRILHDFDENVSWGKNNLSGKDFHSTQQPQKLTFCPDIFENAINH